MKPNIVLMSVAHSGSSVLAEMISRLGWNIKDTEMRKRGIDILSYFVSGSYERESTFNDFKAMYGSSAKVIGMNDVRQIAKTMNNLFLAK